MAGSLQIYGCGTALFLVEDEAGQPFVLRVHNCLYGQGQFNLLSVSQICQGVNNSVDFNLDSPALLLSTGPKKRPVRLPLFLEDGLFAISGTPFPLDDSRFSSLRKADVTRVSRLCPPRFFLCPPHFFIGWSFSVLQFRLKNLVSAIFAWKVPKLQGVGVLGL